MEGAAGIALGARCTSQTEELVTSIFNVIGSSYVLPESLIDPLTGISGCGPAFAYLFIESLADGGVEMGLSRDEMCIRDRDIHKVIHIIHRKH